jgi:hypothetical protein
VQKVLRFPVEFRKEKLLLAACGTAPWHEKMANQT